MKKSPSAAKKEKISTGISGLDKLLDGGIPPQSVVLVSGSAGCGKTILSLQYLIDGASKGETGLYLTFEERAEKIIDQANQFGWDIEGFGKKGTLKIVQFEEVGIIDILQGIKQHIDKHKPKRLVIDSITFLTLASQAIKTPFNLQKTSVAELYEEMEGSKNQQNEGMILRKLMTDFVKILQERGVTTIATSEVPKDSVWYSRDTYTEFACDGIIHLKSTSIGGDVQRTIEVVKMRNTKMRGGINTFDFTPKGIVIGR